MVKSAQQQSCRQQQDHAHRDLRAHQRVAQKLPASFAGAGMSAIFLQRSVQVLSRTLQSRNQPKPDPRQERKPQPVAEHTEVGRNIHREGGNLMRQVRDYEPRDCFEGPEGK